MEYVIGVFVGMILYISVMVIINLVKRKKNKVHKDSNVNDVK